MKITTKFLSIPPYISTSWDNVDYIKGASEEGKIFLIIGLKSGLPPVIIPNLSSNILEGIFLAHLRYLEEKQTPAVVKPELGLLQEINKVVGSFLNSSSNEGFIQSLLQHNPELANGPALPQDLLDKLLEVTKDLPLDNVPMPAQPHCQCLYCQLIRGAQEKKERQNTLEEEVSDQDLQFCDWQVIEISGKLFQVVNPLDCHEVYNVYLGDPLGCTCGHKGCEHIQAVLKT